MPKDASLVLFDDLDLNPSRNPLIKKKDTKPNEGSSDLERANNALHALKCYVKGKGDHSQGEDAETIIGDFMADLMHMCRLTGVDFDRVIAKGRMHYISESNY